MDIQNFQTFLLVGIIAAMLGSMLAKNFTNPFFYALFHFPGVMLHELAHATVGFIMNGRILLSETTFIPRKNPYGEWTIASVSFSNVKWYNALPIAMAPIILLSAPFVTWYYAQDWIDSASWWEVAGIVLLNMIIAESAFPSRQDWRVAFSHPFGIIFYLVVAFGIYSWMTDFVLVKQIMNY